MGQFLQVLRITERIGELCDKMPDDPGHLDQPNSDLRRLIDALPQAQVDSRLTITQGLHLARGSLGLVRDIVNNGLAIVPSVLPVLLRSALLGAGRVLYMLGPEDEDDRIANTLVVLQQEAASFHRAYTQFAEFEQFQALVPPPELVARYEQRRSELMRGRTPPGEAKTLDAMAAVIGEMLATVDIVVPHQELDDAATAAKEHVRWLFHVYSGVSHGLAWPWLIPGTASLPGHFIADFTTVTNVVYLAADITLRRASIV